MYVCGRMPGSVIAPSIEFDRNHRSVLASGSASQPVSTVMVQTGKQGRIIPDTTITSGQLTYVDSERKYALQRRCDCQ